MRWTRTAAAIWLWATPLAAQQVSPASLELLKAVTSHEVGPAFRAQYRTALRSYCGAIASKVPRNTPAETKWVDQEMSDSLLGMAPATRYDRLQGSIEYSRYILRWTVEKCSSTIALIEGAKNPREEAAHWSDLAWQLSSVDDFQKAAKILGLYSNAADPDSIESYAAIHQTILGKILSPMLRE